MPPKITHARVGELRPSQILYSFGVGALVDLPYLSVMVMGLDDWDTSYLQPIGEERLLAAVRKYLGTQIQNLCLPPIAPQEENALTPSAATARIGVPVMPFPRWVRCPRCDLLARIDSGLFDLKQTPYHPERTRYVHTNCARGTHPPVVFPVRFLIACKGGHLDDFPWLSYVHQGSPCNAPVLRLREFGVSGEASDIQVKCDACNDSRRMGNAFGQNAWDTMACRGHRPHLRDTDSEPCEQPIKTILLGASNSWFPITLSGLSIPAASNELAQLVEEHWLVLDKATTRAVLEAFRDIGQLKALSHYSLDQIWGTVEARRNGAPDTGEQEPGDLKIPEWGKFSQPDTSENTTDFRLRAVPVPVGYESVLSRVVLAERLREVRALIHFTRIEPPGDFSEIADIPKDRRVPLSRKSPRWVPASEVRGEGFFLQFNEDAIIDWQSRPEVQEREREFQAAHQQWRRSRGIFPEQDGFPGIRYVLLHSVAHALMRQLALECGYTAASIRERIYAREPEQEDGPMAGILLYTAAPDSEGTLGGLVTLGAPETLVRHLDQALEQIRLCTSDPLCAEHELYDEEVTLHGAACHACLFAPETSCERGNKYLDRNLLASAFASPQLSFFRDVGSDGG